MPIVFVLAGVVIMAVIFLFGLAWALIVVTPFYLPVGALIFIIARNARRRAELAAWAERHARMERKLNSQEFNAWHAVVEDERRKASRRDKALRRFDKTGS